MSRKAPLLTRLDLSVYLLFVTVVMFVTANLLITVAGALGFLWLSNDFMGFMPLGLPKNLMTLLLGVGPVAIFLVRYQQKSHFRLRAWELPAFGALFAAYAYLWALATAVGLGADARRPGRLGEDGARQSGDILAVRVATVLGTRPEVIKLAPVIRRPGRSTWRGEHRRLDRAASRAASTRCLALFGIEPEVVLDVMQPGAAAERPDRGARCGGSARRCASSGRTVVVVQGDTTTTFCGALAAFYEGIAVGHVEAGLRSWDMPLAVPGGGEPPARRASSPSYHFCPTPGSADNLAAEGVPRISIYVTGNTVIDALLLGASMPRVVCRRRSRRVRVSADRRSRSTGARATATRCAGSATTIRSLATRGDTEVVFPVHPNPGGARRSSHACLEALRACTSASRSTTSHFVQLLDSADLVLTDSGGIAGGSPVAWQACARPPRHDRAAGGDRRRGCAPRRNGSRGGLRGRV